MEHKLYKMISYYNRKFMNTSRNVVILSVLFTILSMIMWYFHVFTGGVGMWIYFAVFTFIVGRVYLRCNMFYRYVNEYSSVAAQSHSYSPINLKRTRLSLRNKLVIRDLKRSGYGAEVYKFHLMSKGKFVILPVYRKR